MSDLPKSYMRIARDITGYWGTYLPSLELRVGSIGRRVDGVFVREGHLSRYPAYSTAKIDIDDRPGRGPTVVWATRSVRMEVLNAEAKAPGEVATGGVRLNFGGANEAAIICNTPREQYFADTLAIKELMWQLRKKGEWDDALCVVTGLVSVGSAWICFATESGQAAEIKATAPLALPGDPTAALSALSGSASLEASHSAATSSAFCASLPSGGTPLFRALKFNRLWLEKLSLGVGEAGAGLCHGRVRRVRGTKLRRF
jgi:hypothetical protein